jgi:hypothetical protein
MKIWTGYASSHSVGFYLNAGFTCGGAATEALHLLRIFAEATRNQTSPTQAAACFEDPETQRAIADMTRWQRAVAQYDGSTWPCFTVSIDAQHDNNTNRPDQAAKPTLVYLVISSDCGELAWGSPVQEMASAFRRLLETLGAVEIDASFDG